MSGLIQIECDRCPWFDESLEAVTAVPEEILDAEDSLDAFKSDPFEPSCQDSLPDTSLLTCAPVNSVPQSSTCVPLPAYAVLAQVS